LLLCFPALGANWEALAPPPDGGYVVALAATSDKLYAFGRHGGAQVLERETGRWKYDEAGFRVASPSRSRVAVSSDDVVYVATKTAVPAGGQAEAVFYRAPGDSAWQVMAAPSHHGGSIDALAVDQMDRLWIHTYGGLYMRTVDSPTWVQMGALSGLITVNHLAASGTDILISTSDGLWRWSEGTGIVRIGWAGFPVVTAIAHQGDVYAIVLRPVWGSFIDAYVERISNQGQSVGKPRNDSRVLFRSDDGVLGQPAVGSGQLGTLGGQTSGPPFFGLIRDAVHWDGRIVAATSTGVFDNQLGTMLGSGLRLLDLRAALARNTVGDIVYAVSGLSLASSSGWPQVNPGIHEFGTERCAIFMATGVFDTVFVLGKGGFQLHYRFGQFDLPIAAAEAGLPEYPGHCYIQGTRWFPDNLNGPRRIADGYDLASATDGVWLPAPSSAVGNGTAYSDASYSPTCTIGMCFFVFHYSGESATTPLAHNATAFVHTVYPTPRAAVLLGSMIGGTNLHVAENGEFRQVFLPSPCQEPMDLAFSAPERLLIACRFGGVWQYNFISRTFASLSGGIRDRPVFRFTRIDNAMAVLSAGQILRLTCHDCVFADGFEH
jgi:hypothetical protein